MLSPSKLIYWSSWLYLHTVAFGQYVFLIGSLQTVFSSQISPHFESHPVSSCAAIKTWSLTDFPPYRHCQWFSVTKPWALLFSSAPPEHPSHSCTVVTPVMSVEPSSCTSVSSHFNYTTSPVYQPLQSQTMMMHIH